LSAIGYVVAVLDAIDNGRVSPATLVSLVFLALLVIPSITRDRPTSYQTADPDPTWAPTAALFMPLMVISLLLTAASARTAGTPTPSQVSVSPTSSSSDGAARMGAESQCFVIHARKDRSESTPAPEYSTCGRTTHPGEPRGTSESP
jgi:hypothetical protein